jgi:hypothetical protein
VLFKYSLNGRRRDTYFATNFSTAFFTSVTIVYNGVDDSLLNIRGNLFSTPFAGLILKVVIKEDLIYILTILYCLFY